MCRLLMIFQTLTTLHILERIGLGLFLLKRAIRSNGEKAGDIIPLNQLRSLVDTGIAPRFGEKANSQLTNTNSLSFASEFWLNKYFDKELFYSLS